MRSLPFFSHFVLQTGNWQTQRVLGCQFPPRNAKWLKNGKLRKAILSAFYNISHRNFGILLILWCSFKLWWNFCLDLLRSKFCLLRKWSIEPATLRFRCSALTNWAAECRGQLSSNYKFIYILGYCHVYRLWVSIRIFVASHSNE